MTWVLRKSAVLLALGVMSVTAAPEPRAAFRVKYTAPAHGYSGTFSLPDSRAVNDNLLGADPEAMWPVGVFLPPQTVDQGYPWPSQGHSTRAGYGSEPEDYDYDPLLLTGQDAKAFVQYMFGRGELFFDDVPHARAVLRNQEERRANGLAGNRLGSNRPHSPFYLWRRPRSSRRRRQ